MGLTHPTTLCLGVLAVVGVATAGAQRDLVAADIALWPADGHPGKRRSAGEQHVVRHT